LLSVGYAPKSIAADFFPLTASKTDSLFLESICLREQDKTEQAFETLLQAYKTDTTSAAVLAELSRYYLYEADFSKAIETLEQAVRNCPEITYYKQLLAEIQRDLGNLTEAEQLFDELSNQFPEKNEYLLNLSDINTKLNNIDKAIDALEKIENNLGKNETITTQKLKLYAYSINNEKVLETTLSLCKQFPEQSIYKLLAAQLFDNSGDTETAKQYALQATETEPHNSGAWLTLLDFYIREKNYTQIITVCDSALSANPDLRNFYFYRGDALHATQQYQSAIESFEKGLNLADDSDHDLKSQICGQIGDSYYKTGNLEKTYEFYEKALQYNENNLSVLNNYAYTLSLNGENLDQAERMSSRCVRALPTNPIFLDTYAWILFRKGNYSMAKLYIENAMTNNIDNYPEIVEHYGDIMYKLEKTDKALQNWQKALQIKQEQGNADVETLMKKINDKQYYETPQK